jgi:ATP-dependent helicase/nuclease subunit A
VLAETANPFASDLGKKQKEIIADKLQHILNQLRHTQRLYKNRCPDGDWAQKCEDIFIKPVEQCIELFKADDWDKFAEEIRNFKKPRVNKPKELPTTIAELIYKTVKKAVDAFEQLSDLAIVNPDYLDKVSGAVSLQTKVLVELVKKFDWLYSRAKRAVNCLDFADLEHYALKLLTDENSSEDNLLPSQTALALRRRYKYIFVDEYQDINPVQQAILDLLSSEDNVFVVGDVKQSIYAWRGAEPEIFLERLKPAPRGRIDQDDVLSGLRVDLIANFRSAKGILDFVNKIFARIMTASFAKIDYDDSARLKPALEDESKGNTTAEFHILNEQNRDTNLQNQQISETANDENLNVISSRQRQAGMIAQRIRQMVGADIGKPEFQIYDKQENKFRDVEYRDIVILMRSLAKKANDYVEVLRLAGVPVSCQSSAGYFEATEISDCLCLLKVLDNPQRDIELAAALRSPFFGISDTELAKIKIHSETDEHNKNFYDRVAEYCNSGRDAKLAGRLKGILNALEQWRTLARRGNLADLIWQAYRQTGFLSFVSALPNGQARRANLLKLHDRAIQFEGFASSAGIPSLTRFVEFIEKLQEAGEDWAPAEPESAAGNAVRILSVHKSKGLEFPVVFLAELDSRFNKRDIQRDFLADAGDTLGLQIIDRESNSKLRSLAHEVIAEQKLSTALAEEMRILYVATTRARDRLILSACEKLSNCRTIICNGFFFGDEPIPSWQLRWCQSPLDWVLYGLSDQKNLHSVLETELAARGDDHDLFSIKVYEQRELEQLSGYILKLKRDKSRRLAPTAKKLQTKRTESKLLSQVKESLSWRYEFGDAPLLPAKTSVTAITHRNDEYVKIDYSTALERKPKAVLSADLASAVEGRLMGTATHLVIAQLDLASPVTKEAIEKVIDKLLADDAITEAVAEHIDTKSIITFFQRDLGRLVLDSENTVCREWPFTFAMPASEWKLEGLDKPQHDKLNTQHAIQDTIIVQGIIDMLVLTPDGLVVIDFKTDRINAEKVSERAELYRRQLELYGRAASAILKSKIIGKWLYFLTPGCEVEVE